jgi:phosphoglycerol transferase MdoB-like AlkP superfamily enzyme
MARSWDRFTGQFRRDCKLWLFLMLILSCFRLFFIVYFRDKLDGATAWTEALKAVVNGLRYDGVVATYIMLVSLILTVLCGFTDLRKISDRVRWLTGSSFVVLSTAIWIITLAYFREYNDHFNHFIFNLYYDDTKAILSTIWAGYHVIPNVLAISVLSFVLLKASRRFMNSSILTEPLLFRRPFPVALRITTCMVVTLLIATAARGSYTHRTVKLEDAAVTSDGFLNKAVLNPYSALMYAYRTHRKLGYVMGAGLEMYLPDHNVRGAAQEVFNDRRVLDNLDEYLRRTAAGPGRTRPRHIFLVVMESYDAWPLMKKYSALGLTPELSSLARNGIPVDKFLPSSDGTATSLSALISGLPDANVVTNYQQSSQTPYPSSIAASFKRLGYRTRFFYGGYLSWQKIGEFAQGQGFDDVYGAAHVGSWASHNEWGVEDEALFDFTVGTVEQAAGLPSLNVILTTSYHPPYELDVYGKGFPLREVPADLAHEFDGSVTLRMLGHLWYSDRCIGDFVRKAEKKFDKTLFAFTGDHFGRKFINSHPGPFEASAVPFILYGRQVLRGLSVPADPVGSHIDVAPTLIELSAPAGFSYYAVGRNIFGREPNRFGLSRGKVMSRDFIFDVYGGTFAPLPGRALPKSLPDPKELKLLHDRTNGIAWWRIMRGAAL